MKHLEIKTIEHKGVKVCVEINYDTGMAALVETQGAGMRQPKKWVFSGRGLEYMNGWLEIMEAMVIAVKDIKKELEQDLAEKSAFKKSEQEGISRIILDATIEEYGKKYKNNKVHVKSKRARQ